MPRRLPHTLGLVLAWVAAAVVAVAVGLVAVTGVGASVRDRGPVTGDERAVREALVDDEGAAEPDSDAERVETTFADEFGEIDVACQGAVAFGDDVRPATGWRTISLERGPDDDIDVVVASGSRSVEVEVYCNGGVPRIGDREDKQLGDVSDTDD